MRVLSLVAQASLSHSDVPYGTPVLQVHIVVDAVSSQRSTDRAAGLHRAAQSGAFLVTSEMAFFQLMQVRRKACAGLHAAAGSVRWEPPRLDAAALCMLTIRGQAHKNLLVVGMWLSNQYARACL